MTSLECRSVIGMVSGMMADWAAGEKHEIYDDMGYGMWYGGLREIFKARPGFNLVSVEGVVDPLTYNALNAPTVAAPSSTQRIPEPFKHSPMILHPASVGPLPMSQPFCR